MQSLVSNTLEMGAGGAGASAGADDGTENHLLGTIEFK